MKVKIRVLWGYTNSRAWGHKASGLIFEKRPTSKLIYHGSTKVVKDSEK